MSETKNRAWNAFFGCGGISILFLVVLIGAISLACAATLLVPIYDQAVLQELSCPPGTTLVTGWEETTYTQSGEQVLYGYCEDTEGNQFPTNDLGYGALKYYPKYFVYSLVASFVLTLLVVIPLILIYQFIKRKFFSKPSSNTTL